RDFLTERYGLAVGGVCRQACYTRREALRVQHRDIRRHTVDDLDHVAGRYQACERAYLRQRLLAEAMYGVYMSGGEMSPVGFIGIHEDGSMGMLYVDEAYRRQGLASSLEGWLVNRHLKRGEIPYCRVEEGNPAAMCLQEKLGLCLCGEPMWWLEK
ncbi:MAG: GNAT family N-acetyltransferase, partial [Acetatifactor sp.]|nr:GNAT family N-acetyltransferase [Acetatifactor sp.]